jgi:hypothetical protein
MTIVAAAPIRVRMSRIFEAALVYANVSPPEITSTDPIKVSCQSIAIASPRILLVNRTKLYRRDALLVRTWSGSADLEPSSRGGALGGARTPSARRTGSYRGQGQTGQAAAGFGRATA